MALPTIIITNQLSCSVPPPTSVVVMSNRDNPIRPVGSNVTLTCNIELSPTVDIEVNMTIVWTGPNNNIIKNNTYTLMGNTAMTLESNITVRASGRRVSGDYTCIVSIRVSKELQYVHLNDIGARASNKTSITTGKHQNQYHSIIGSQKRAHW